MKECMQVEQIVRKHLEDNGFDGLFNENGECACLVTDLNPCSEMSARCEAGYLRKTIGGFDIQREKPITKEEDHGVAER